MSKQHRLNKRQWAEIIEKIKNNTHSITELSNEYGISSVAIYSYCWRHGILKKVSKRD